MAVSKRSKAEPPQLRTTSGREPAAPGPAHDAGPRDLREERLDLRLRHEQQQAAGGLRVVEQGLPGLLGPAPVLDARLERLAVRREPSRLELLGELERPRQQRQRLELDLEREAALARDPRGVAGEPEAGDVGRRLDAVRERRGGGLARSSAASSRSTRRPPLRGPGPP